MTDRTDEINIEIRNFSEKNYCPEKKCTFWKENKCTKCWRCKNMEEYQQRRMLSLTGELTGRIEVEAENELEIMKLRDRNNGLKDPQKILALIKKLPWRQIGTDVYVEVDRLIEELVK